MIRLGVNIDHVATLRQARGEPYPSPVEAAMRAIAAGAANITCHLREDRRHIQDRDVRALRDAVCVPLNFEIAVTDEMLDFAISITPHTVTLVPEKRQELTTEGGLALSVLERLKPVCSRMKSHGIRPVLFVEPKDADVHLAADSGAHGVEFHTGRLCHALSLGVSHKDGLGLMGTFAKSCQLAKSLGLAVHVGHGLNYQNAHWLQVVPEIEEANIGHAIVSQAVMVGMHQAVLDMISRLNDPSWKLRC